MTCGPLNCFRVCLPSVSTYVSCVLSSSHFRFVVCAIYY